MGIVITSMRVLTALRDRLLTTNRFNFDVETNDPDLNLRPKVVGCQFGFESKGQWHAVYIPFWHVKTVKYTWDGTNLNPVYETLPGLIDEGAFFRLFHPIFCGEETKTMVGSGLKYECKIIAEWCNKYDLPFKMNLVLEDTVMSSSILNRRIGPKWSNGLKARSKAELGITQKDFLDMCPIPNQTPEVPIDIMAPYCYDDVTNPELLIQKHIKDMGGEDGLKTRYWRLLESPIIEAVAHMEYIGTPVDINVLQELHEEWSLIVEETSNAITDLCSEEINLNSPYQLSDLAFDRYKWWDDTILKKKLKKFRVQFERGNGTKKYPNGVYSVSEDVIKDVLYHKAFTCEEGKKLAELVLKCRKTETRDSRFALGLQDFIAEDGRIHCTFWQTGTVTGRFSSSDPNLQQIPSKDADGRRLRKAFIAQPGWVLVGADYSQLEFRILAHYMNDSELIQLFIDGGDPHQMTADRLGITRDASKVVNYGVIYGQGPSKLGKSLGISYKVAQSYLEGFAEMYPGHPTFKAQCMSQVRKTKKIKNLFGYDRDFTYEIQNGYYIDNAACNYPIQSSAGVIMKLAMKGIWEKMKSQDLTYKKVNMLLQVHDELLFEVREDYAEEFMNTIVIPGMENAFKLKCPLTVDANKGASWYDVH